VVAAVRAGGSGKPETQLIERPGKQHLRVYAAPVSPGSNWRALLFIQDLTEAVRTEQMRRDFVANVSHELRTPLASLKAVIDTLKDGAIQDEAATSDFLARADGEVYRLVQMVEELLELSRIESGDLPLTVKPFAIESIVRSAVERLRPQAQNRRIAIETDVPAGLPPLNGDPERLERVIVNLVHNAVKFTPEGGSVRVSASASREGLTVRVQDTGVGIDATDVPRVFERFYKADRARAGGGAGLGLAVVKHTVEAHGG